MRAWWIKYDTQEKTTTLKTINKLPYIYKKCNSSALTNYLCNNRDSLLAAQSQVV